MKQELTRSLLKGIFLLLILVSSELLFAQKGRSDSYRMVFYNVENLFDTEDDPQKRDDEFTPDGAKFWTNRKLYDKLHKISKVVMGVGEWELPDLVSFAELENRAVLEKLLKETALSKFDYQIMHFESPDKRGIDVGLIYRLERFRIFHQEAIPIVFPWDSTYKTRDILFVSGETRSGDTVHVFVNHWPSRWRGYLETEPSRMHVAGVLRKKVDELLKSDGNANILIMGDFNDQPEDRSMNEVLNAAKPGTDADLINLMRVDGIHGTHKHQGDWGILDQVVVSRSLLDSKGGLITERAEVYCGEFLIQKDDKYQGDRPFRTYIGMKYKGGYSDHLPIYLDIRPVKQP